MINEVQDMINSLAVMNIARIETHAKNVAMPVTAGIGIILGDKNIDYKTMRYRMKDMVNDNHKDFIKTIIRLEKGINDEIALDMLYDIYMDDDIVNFLHEEFDCMIEDLREQGQIKDLPYV